MKTNAGSSTSRIMAALVGFALLGAAACRPSAEKGSAQVVMLALSAAEVTSVRLTISGPGIEPAMVVPLVKTGDQWSGLVDRIPVGSDRIFLAEAFDALPAKIYEGRATGVTISQGTTAMVAIVAQQVNAPLPFRNAAPVIDAIFVSSTAVAPGETIQVRVNAHDPNAGEPLAFVWSASGGAFSAATAAATGWTAPAAEGAVALTVAVTDPKGAGAQASLSVSVSAAHGKGKAAVTVTMNTWPVISSVAGEPARVTLGTSTALDVTASDSDGDTLSYAWTCDCPGTFSSTTARSPAFTPSAAPMSSACTFSVIADDGRGGSNSGTLVLPFGDAPTPNRAPEIVSSFQSRGSAGGGETVVLRVGAVDPEGSPVTFAWSMDEGSLGTPVESAGQSEISWIAPSCFRSGTSGRIEVTVTDGGPVPARQSFTVASTGAGACALEITFDDGQLPSAHGWSFEGRDHASQPITESQVATVSGGILRLDTVGVGQGTGSDATAAFWKKDFPFDPGQYFMEVRMRAELPDSARFSCRGFLGGLVDVGVGSSNYHVAVSLMPGQVTFLNADGPTCGGEYSASVDGRSFRTYRAEVRGRAVRMFIDGVLLDETSLSGTGTSPTTGAGFGDGSTSGGNVVLEYDYIRVGTL